MLIVYGDYPPKPRGQSDGGADFVQNLAEQLVSRGVAVDVLVSRRDGRDDDFVTSAGVRVLPRVQDWSLGGVRRGEFRALMRLLRTSSYDVVHVIYPDPYLRYGGDRYHLPFLLKLAGARRLLITFFGFGYTGSKLVSKFGLAMLFLLGDRLVITDRQLLARFWTVFPFWRRKAAPGLVGGIRSSDVRTWHEHERAQIRSKLPLPTQGALVAFFGFWSPDKGLEDLLMACATLLRDGRDIHLLLIGGRESDARTPYERSVLELVHELGLEGRTLITGPLANDSVVQHLLASDLCALPFRVNPLGRSSLALALATGVPTIVSRPSTGAEDLSGLLLIRPAAPDELAAAIDRLTSDADLRGAVSMAGLAAARRYSWEAIADNYISQYERLAT